MASWGAMRGEEQHKVLRMYIDEIDEALDRSKDAAALVATLQDVRGRLRKDFLAGNLNERRYRNIVGRIGIETVDARLDEVAPLMAELPPGVRVRFEVLLEDGVLTQDEYDMFAKMLDVEEVPAKVKGQLLPHLAKWVAEDSTHR